MNIINFQSVSIILVHSVYTIIIELSNMDTYS
jgi:hypothetical protein